MCWYGHYIYSQPLVDHTRGLSGGRIQLFGASLKRDQIFDPIRRLLNLFLCSSTGLQVSYDELCYATLGTATAFCHTLSFLTRHPQGHHDFVWYVLDFDCRAYHRSWFSNAPPSQLPLSITIINLGGHVVLYHVIRSLCRFRGSNYPPAWSPLLSYVAILRRWISQTWSYMDLTDLRCFTQLSFP